MRESYWAVWKFSEYVLEGCAPPPHARNARNARKDSTSQWHKKGYHETYYYNKVTKKMQWKKPDDLQHDD